jgi:PAS domain-containing protein
MERIEVMTPSGPGIIWGIDRGKVIVEMDYSYYELVEFDPEDVEGIE